MSTVFSILSRLATVIIICAACLFLFSINCHEGRTSTLTAVEEVVNFLPPPPPITVPAILATPVKYSAWQKVLSFIEGPCHPVLESFISAFNYRELRSYVIPVIKEENSGEFNLGAICDVFDFLSTWKYIDDPAGVNVITPATTTWGLRAGDCDDLSCCQSAAVTTIGGVTRVIFASNADSAHAWCEVCLGSLSRSDAENYLRARYHLSSDVSLFFREDERGLLWLNLDWTADHPGGANYRATTGAIYYPTENRCETF